MVPHARASPCIRARLRLSAGKALSPVKPRVRQEGPRACAPGVPAERSVAARVASVEPATEPSTTPVEAAGAGGSTDAAARPLPKGTQGDPDFKAKLDACEDIRTLCRVARQRVSGRSATEIGWVLQAVRRVSGGNMPLSKALLRLTKEVVYECKSVMPGMPPRSIANNLFHLMCLRSLDKVLMVKAERRIAQCVAADPAAFKTVELAQILRATSQLNFKGRRLNMALAVGVNALAYEDLNPRSASTMVLNLMKLQVNNEQATIKLCQFLANHATALDVSDIRTALQAMVDCEYAWAEEFVQKLQEAIRRHRMSDVGVLSAAIILQHLLARGSLRVDCGNFLIRRLEREEGGLNESGAAVFARIRPQLEEQGYYVSNVKVNSKATTSAPGGHVEVPAATISSINEGVLM